MKKYALLAAVALLSFGGGAAGLYFAFPSISPDRAESVRFRLDSLARADSLMAAGRAPDLAFMPGDSLPSGGALDSLSLVLPLDTLRALAVRADSNRVLVQSRMIALLEDSLRTTVAELQSTLAQASQLRERLTVQEERLDARGIQRVDAAGMSATLSKLEDKELQALVENMDMRVLEQLYLSTSSRNQARLLKALSPSRGAQFVQNLMRGEPTPRQEAPSPRTAKVSDGVR